ncbi:MAG: twin-arginine translocation signal domain-containing protein [Pirellulales bacterium]|nr:twin-arginine translocation signal domain-containing protein [Pirellulales bacterium]
MQDAAPSRRTFLKTVGLAGAGLSAGALGSSSRPARADDADVDGAFFVRPEELTLKHHLDRAARRLSFGQWMESPEAWREAVRKKLVELLGFTPPEARPARRIRTVRHGDVTIEAWVMRIDATLSVPAYLLVPAKMASPGRAVMAIHGHGAVEGPVGQYDDYHHRFALRLAEAGRLVLCPALRGFGPLANLSAGDPRYALDYWGSDRGRQFTLVTDAFLFGQTLVGQTVEDLLRWEAWLAGSRGVETFDVAGISYGGDLAIVYPALSGRVGKIYSSGSLGSFSVIFSRCYNAPAHCVPGVLEWMDRSDIAGLSAPRPIRLHYGALDVPGPDNNSASYNETVQPSLDELKAIYRASDAEDRVSLHVTPKSHHEFDLEDLLAYL